MKERGKTPHIDSKTEDILAAQKWLSEIDIWLVEHIDSRHATKAQTSAKKMRDVLRSIQYWQERIERQYVVRSSFENVNGKTIWFSEEESRKRQEAEKAKIKARAQEKFNEWIPTLHYYIRIIQTYLRKICEWEDGRAAPKKKRQPIGLKGERIEWRGKGSIAYDRESRQLTIGTDTFSLPKNPANQTEVLLELVVHQYNVGGSAVVAAQWEKKLFEQQTPTKSASAARPFRDAYDRLGKEIEAVTRIGKFLRWVDGGVFIPRNK